MDQKIQMERERNKLFVASQKLVNLLMEHGIDVNLPELRGIKGPNGISLIPGDCEVTTIEYEPFRNDF